MTFLLCLILAQSEFQFDTTGLDSANFEQFKASSGWLEKWKATYVIANHLDEGESGEVQEQTIQYWMDRLREIFLGY